MRLHDAPASGNCLKVRLLLARLGLEYERVPVDIFAGEAAADDFRTRHNVAGRTPVLELDDGRSLPESGAILQYLAAGTPYLPGDAYDQARIAAWLFFEQNLIEGHLGTARYWMLTRADVHPAALERHRQAATAALQVLEEHLGDRRYVHGESETIADLALYAYVHVAPDAGIALGPATETWIEAVRAHPAHVDDLEPYPTGARRPVDS